MSNIPVWLRLKASFGNVNANVRLALQFAGELLNGAPYSRETLARCYEADKTSGESESVSEKWINLLWSRIRDIRPEEWHSALGSEKAFVDFVYRFWGKDL